MTLRKTPKGTAWFLKQFGTQSEDDSVIGDLTERYQRGGGLIWYWRQVLSIVFVGFYREVLRNKWQFVKGLIQTWCVLGGLQFTAGVVLLARFVLRHPEQLPNSLNVDGVLRLISHSRMIVSFAEQMEIFLLRVALEILTLLAIGAVCARLRYRISPGTMLLGFLATYIGASAAYTLALLVTLAQYGQPDVERIILSQTLIVLPITTALILFGGIRGQKRNTVPEISGT